MKSRLRRSRGLRYAFAVLLACLAAGAQFAVHWFFDIGDDADAYEFFLCATALSSIWAGRLCAFVTLLCSTCIRLYFFLPPHGSFRLEYPAGFVRLLLFLAIGSMIGLGGGALYASQEAWVSALSSIDDAVVVTDNKKSIRFLNPAAEYLTEWRRREAAGQSVHDVVRIVDEKSEAPRELPIETTLRRGIVAHLAVGSMLVSRSGRRVPVEDSISPILGATHQPHGAIMVLRDVTERRKAENALRESENRYRFLTDTVPEIIMTADAHGQCDYFNQRWHDYTGLTAEQSLGEGWMSALHPDDRRRVASRWTESVRLGEGYEFEFRLQSHDGRRRWFLARGSPMRDENGVVLRWLGTCADVDDFKRTQEQLHQALKMEAVGRLAGGVAHDFNNLLTVIIGYAELLSGAAESAGDPTPHSLQQILYASQRASELTRQLLTFSRRQIVEPRVLNLNAVLGETEIMLSRLIGEHIDVQTTLGPDLLAVKIDRGQIEQVIVNLAVNARDAMPDGGRLIFETANVDLDESYPQRHVGVAPGRYVMLRVSDTGQGMDDETLDRIFEPFFTTKGPQQGTGLGLSTVYGIVKQSGGHIWTYSEPGRGTTFKIYLPAVLDSAAAPAPPVADPAQWGGTETILVLEDEEAVRKAVLTMLGQRGYTVLEAKDPEDALRQCREYGSTIHLLLTDVVMPQMNGPQLAEQAARILPDLKVLFMSGYTGDILDHHRIVDSGAPFLSKPFSLEALLRKVRDVLDA